MWTVKVGVIEGQNVCVTADGFANNNDATFAGCITRCENNNGFLAYLPSIALQEAVLALFTDEVRPSLEFRV